MPAGVAGRVPGHVLAVGCSRAPGVGHTRHPVGERERQSQRVFWGRWSEFFDARGVHTDDGKLHVIYVTEDTGVGGGHRDIFEHLNRLRQRGHEAELWTLGDAPDWFALDAPVRSFEDYEELVGALAPMDAIKVATWWNTAGPVWQASVPHGIPVYFVQDIETSYYPNNQPDPDAVLASYRHEFRYMTISSWNRDRLRELGLDATLIPPGIDLENFRPLTEVERRPDMVLALGRSNPLKNLPLTLAAWRALPEPRPELCLFGIEPEIADDEPGVRYVTAPSDAEVNRLFNEATVLSRPRAHEGFCLPPSSRWPRVVRWSAPTRTAIATTAPTARTASCPSPRCPLSARASRACRRQDLRRRFGRGRDRDRRTYAWSQRLDALEQFLEDAARPRRVDLSRAAVPELRRAPVT